MASAVSTQAVGEEMTSTGQMTTTDYLVYYLQLVTSQHPESRTQASKQLLELVLKRDPNALEFLRENRDDEFLSPYATRQNLQILEKDYGLRFDTDEECITALRFLIKNSKKNKIKNALQKCISYLELPTGAPLTNENFPAEDLGNVLEKLFQTLPQYTGLIRGCILYMKDSMNVAAEE